MFGLSATKIVLLIVVIAAVIFGSRLLRSLNRAEPRRGDDGAASHDAAGPTALERCDRCGAYADLASHRCTGSDAGSSTRGPG